MTFTPNRLSAIIILRRLRPELDLRQAKALVTHYWTWGAQMDYGPGPSAREFGEMLAKCMIPNADAIIRRKDIRVRALDALSAYSDMLEYIHFQYEGACVLTGGACDVETARFLVNRLQAVGLRAEVDKGATYCFSVYEGV